MKLNTRDCPIKFKPVKCDVGYTVKEKIIKIV